MLEKDQYQKLMTTESLESISKNQKIWAHKNQSISL